MVNEEAFKVQRKTARIAGFWYLLMLITGPVGMMYVPSRIIIAGDATETANNIVSFDFLFRIGIMSNIICQITFVFLVIALYNLLKTVNMNYARLMVSLVLVAVPIAFLNELTQITALLIKDNVDYLKVFEKSQIDTLTMLVLNIHQQGILLAGFFWGLWLLPLGLLVIKSGFIPKIIGIFLVLGCFSYLADSTTSLLIPRYEKVVSDILMIPLGIGEVSMIFWLLIKGVKATHAYDSKNN
jgi:hypothetical protein